MPPLKVGLIGYGFSTKCFHLPFIAPNPDLEIYAFLQRKEAPQDKGKVESGVHCTIDYPQAKHYRTADEFFGCEGIELVVVCSGHDSHFEMARRALGGGKHVEKPFTLTTPEADALIALSKKQGKVLTVFQNRRYDSDFRTLQHLVAQDAFGEITAFANHYDMDSPEWALKWPTDKHTLGEGMLYGIGTHTIDQTLVLFGVPASVTAVTRVLRGGGAGEGSGGGAEDMFTLLLQYGGKWAGLVAEVKTTVVSPFPMGRMLKYEIKGSGGGFVKNGEDPQITHLLSGLPVSDPRFGVEPESYHGFLSTTKPQLDGVKLEESGDGKFTGIVQSERGSYVDYYRDVVAAIRGEKAVVVKPEESRMGIRVIELARESAERGVSVAWSES
ncbi:hypothetical protein LTR08_003132 [Meristemomyces frigidus]|nr:hypothetical protein LTR08_003132 [Meristemomyces frigidus]